MGEMRSGMEDNVLRGIDSTRMDLKQKMNAADTRIYDAGVLTSLMLLARKHGGPCRKRPRHMAASVQLPPCRGAALLLVGSRYREWLWHRRRLSLPYSLLSGAWKPPIKLRVIHWRL